MDDALADPKLPSRWASAGTKLPETLRHLHGPSAGVAELPIDLAWSGDRNFDLGDARQRDQSAMPDAVAAATYFTGPELIALCRGALDDEFSLETLRDQLSSAATYSDEAFARHGGAANEIADLRAWAQNWSESAHGRRSLPARTVHRRAGRRRHLRARG
jgi:hypothetical protein